MKLMVCFFLRAASAAAGVATTILFGVLVWPGYV
jgi:hypothetical protein